MPELQDLYDIHRNPTGEIHVRGESIPDGRYRLGVQVWLRNDAGKLLLTQRHPRKKNPLKWEPTGGAVGIGEDTRTAGVRELQEEIGIDLPPDALQLVRTSLHNGSEFLDTYIAHWNGSIDALTLQGDEVTAALWADYDELAKMDRDGLLACDWIYLFQTIQQ